MSAPRTTTGNPSTFLRTLDWRIKGLEFSGSEGLLVLDDDRRATVTLITGAAGRPLGDEFDGVRVDIVSKTNGHIVKRTFAFDDYLDRSLSARTDGRDDYPLSSNGCFHVTPYIGWRWYIAVPRDDRPFTAAVEDYIDSWR